MASFDLVAFGELLIDFTPAGKSENGMELFERNPGGAPANMLAAAQKSGLKTAFVGKVGNDMHGIFLKEQVEKIGIDTRGLLLDDNYFTTMAFVTLNEEGERDFAFARKPGADTQITFSEIAPSLLMDTKVFHVGSLSLTDEPVRTATYQAVKIARQEGAIISYDPNYRALLWKDKEIAMERMKSLIPHVDIMKISDEETDLLTPYKDPFEAAKYLIDSGVIIVAVTLGAAGTLIASKEGTMKVEGYLTNVVDTTGAGDSFWGGFVSKLISDGRDIEVIPLQQLAEYARYGNAMASLVIEKHGGISAIPEQECVFERMNEYK